MIRWALGVMAAGALGALAQPSVPQMSASSTLVFGGTSNGKQVKFVSRGGGFFIDSRHVVSNLSNCCGKTDKGEQATPIVYAGKDEVIAAKVIWSADDSEIALLELEKPLNHPGVPMLPSKLVEQGEAVYSVQYPKPGENGQVRVVEGKLLGSGTASDTHVQVYKSSLQQIDNNAGGAMFDACGNAIGINYTMRNGAQYAMAVDPLIDALKSAGVQANIGDQRCSESGGAQGGSAGSAGGTKDGGKQSKEKEGDEEKSTSWVRMPHGEEWIPVGIVLGLLALAIRPARRQMAQTSPVLQPVPEPAPYPYVGPPTGYPPTSPPANPLGPANFGAAGASAGANAMLGRGAVPIGAGTTPSLKGIAGQYAGSAFPLEGGTSILGRDPSAANLVFTSEASSVSKRHCSVRWDAASGLFMLEDHGSTNGTFLSTGERLTPHQPRALRPGDRFFIGDLRNQFEVTFES